MDDGGTHILFFPPRAGVLELELSRLPQPARRSEDCALTPRASRWPWRGARGPPHLSLFRQKRVKGWWPCTVQEGGKRRLSVGQDGGEKGGRR